MVPHAIAVCEPYPVFVVPGLYTREGRGKGRRLPSLPGFSLTLTLSRRERELVRAFVYPEKLS